MARRRPESSEQVEPVPREWIALRELYRFEIPRLGVFCALRDSCGSDFAPNPPHNLSARELFIPASFPLPFTDSLLFDLSLFRFFGEPRITSGPAEPVDVQERHDREKSRLIRDETFLKYLGVLDPAGKPRTQMGDKYRQIHHFIELLAPPLRALPNCKELRVVDMGSGKGYLTFAIYAFLKQEGFKVEVVGIERRQALVDLCNSVAGQCVFGDLRFEVGEISTARLDSVDMVVALHACDAAAHCRKTR
jgi:hypothetical protein